MRLSLLVLCGLSLCVIAFSLGVAAVPADAQLDDPENGDNVTQTIEVHVDSDGDAEFRVVTTLEAETESQQQAFESVAAAFEQGQFEDQSLWTVAIHVFDDVNNQTDRTMQLEGPNREATLNEEAGTGELVESFEWRRFANESNDRLEVSDAWTRDGRLWLRSLDAGQSLELRAPEGYEIEDAQPDSFRDRALVWEGPRTFQPGELSATYTRTESDSEGFGLLIAVFAVGIVVVVAAVGFLYMRRSDSSVPRPSTGSASEEGAEGSTPADAETSESAAESADGDLAPEGSAADDSGAAADAEDEQDDIDPELLSDEERVERLLRENGGRMKQANIVKETGWSNAKVSQLLTEMNEEDRVDKLRLGRENLIALPEKDVTEIE